MSQTSAPEPVSGAATATPAPQSAAAPGERKPLALHLAVGSGLLMGAADAIPGVSGGTIALIIGIYERFIDSLHTVVKLPFLVGAREGRGRLWAALRFLLPLGVGIAASYYLATKLLVGPTDSPGLLRRPETAPICYAFFFGLVLVSLREPWVRMKSRRWYHYGVAALGAAASAVFVGLPYATSEPQTWMLLYGGALAIAVMLLPGVSGSMMLVILGQYQTVAGSIHDMNLTVILVLLAGIALGVIGFVPLLKHLLHRHHDVTMAALTGLMAGSLRALWPWKLNYEIKAGPMTNTGVGEAIHWVILAALAGAAVVWLLAIFEKRILASEK